MYVQKEKLNQSNNVSVANSVFQMKDKVQQGCELVDRRTDSINQTIVQAMINSGANFKDSRALCNGTYQLRKNKFITEHAKIHYKDGWGAAYGITNNYALKSAVPDSVTGAGSIDLGEFDAPPAEQTTPGRIKSKDCSIGYEDGRYHDETKIFACGPLGHAKWRGAPTAVPVVAPIPSAMVTPAKSFSDVVAGK